MATTVIMYFSKVENLTLCRFYGRNACNRGDESMARSCIGGTAGPGGNVVDSCWENVAPGSLLTQVSSRVSPACGKSDVVYSVINDRLPDGVAAIVLKKRSVTGIEPPAFPVTATTAAQVVVLVIR